jgi:hypothetical protein
VRTGLLKNAILICVSAGILSTPTARRKSKPQSDFDQSLPGIRLMEFSRYEAGTKVVGDNRCSHWNPL